MMKPIIYGLILLSAGGPWAAASQADPVIKPTARVVVCVVGGYEIKGKTAAECAAMGGHEFETPEIGVKT